MELLYLVFLFFKYGIRYFLRFLDYSHHIDEVF